MSEDRNNLIAELLRRQDLVLGMGATFSAMFMSDPCPMWVKEPVEEPSGSFRMILTNAAFEREYGISPEQYTGTTDRDQWDAKTAQGFFEQDRRALESNAPVVGWEPLYNPKTGTHQRVWARKWPVPVLKGVIGVAGRVEWTEEVENVG